MRNRVQTRHLTIDAAKTHGDAGGNQIDNDQVFKGPLLHGFDGSPSVKEAAQKLSASFTGDMRAEAEQYYFANYALHFSRVSTRGA